MNKKYIFAFLGASFVYLVFTNSGRQLARNVGGYIMDLSDNAVRIIKRFEGFSATPYPDAQGFSIGYGHFIKQGENFTTITREQALSLLRQDAGIAAAAVKNSVRVPLSQDQFDALVSLTYNIGVGAFRNSTLLKKLNAGNYSEAAEQFTVWNKSQGKVLESLVSRRSDERQLFLSA